MSSRHRELCLLSPGGVEADVWGARAASPQLSAACRQHHCTLGLVATVAAWSRQAAETCRLAAGVPQTRKPLDGYRFLGSKFVVTRRGHQHSRRVRYPEQVGNAQFSASANTSAMCLGSISVRSEI